MRTEDLDGPRTVPASVEGNLDEMRWLGIDWDEGPDVGGPYAPYVQSERFELYERALAVLGDAGRLRSCWLSRKDLREAASAPHVPPPAYGPAQRQASDAVAPRRRSEGVQPATRFRVDAPLVEVPEVVAALGRDFVTQPIVRSTADAGGDPVLRRADGTWAYHLAVVVDDAAMRVAEVVRGDDLAPVAALHVLLHQALGTPSPTYLHVPILHGPDGERLSKRGGARSLHDLRGAGVPPERVVGALLWSAAWVDELIERPAHEAIAIAAHPDAWHALRTRPRSLTVDVEAWLAES